MSDIREKIVAYKLIQDRLEVLVSERNKLVSRIAEIKDFLGGIDSLEKGDIIFNLAEGIFRRGKSEKEKFLVDVGAGVLVEKDVGECKEFLKERLRIMEGVLSEIDKEIVKLSSALEKLGKEIEKGVSGAGSVKKETEKHS